MTPLPDVDEDRPARDVDGVAAYVVAVKNELREVRAELTKALERLARLELLVIGDGR